MHFINGSGVDTNYMFSFFPGEWYLIEGEHYAPTDDDNVLDDGEVDYEDNSDDDLMNKCKPLQTISTATSRPQDH